MNYLIILLIPFFISPVSARSQGSLVVKDLRDTSIELRTKLSEREEELKQAQIALKRKETELANKNDDLRKAQEMHREVADELRTQINALKAGESREIERLTHLIAEMRATNEQNQNEGVSKEDLEQAQEKITLLEDQLETLHANNENVSSLLEQIEALKRENAQLTHNIKDREKRLEEVQQELRQLQARFQDAIAASEKSEEKDAKIAELSALLETKHRELEEKNLALKDLHTRFRATTQQSLQSIQLRYEQELQKVLTQASEENEALREELLKAQQTIEELKKQPTAPMPPAENKELNALRDQIINLENQIHQREENEQEAKRAQELTLLKEELAEKERALRSASERVAGLEELEQALVEQNLYIQYQNRSIEDLKMALYELQRQAASQNPRKPTYHNNDSTITAEDVTKIIRTNSISDANNDKIESFRLLAEENARDATKLAEELDRIERMHDEQTKSLRQSRQDALKKDQELLRSQQRLNQMSADYASLFQAHNSDNNNWEMEQLALAQYHHQVNSTLEQHEKTLKSTQQELAETKSTNEDLRKENSQLREKLRSVKKKEGNKPLTQYPSPQDSDDGKIIESYFEDKRVRLQAKTAKPYITDPELTKNYVERHKKFQDELGVFEDFGREMSTIPTGFPEKKHEKLKNDVNERIIDLQTKMSYEAYLFNKFYKQEMKNPQYIQALTSFIELWHPLIGIKELNTKLGRGFFFNILSSPEIKVPFQVGDRIGRVVPISRLIEFLSKKSGIDIKDKWS